MRSACQVIASDDARDAFISAMRRVAGTVGVVTTHGEAGLHGATVSAFCSVSADPPSLLVCLHAKSRIAASVNANRQFCLNILSEEMENVADRFAGRHDNNIKDRFDGIEFQAGANACPVIAGSIALECDLMTVTTSGSHTVFFGEVTGISGTIGKPLTYLDGAYHPWIGYRSDVERQEIE